MHRVRETFRSWTSVPPARYTSLPDGDAGIGKSAPTRTRLADLEKLDGEGLCCELSEDRRNYTSRVCGRVRKKYLRKAVCVVILVSSFFAFGAFLVRFRSVEPLSPRRVFPPVAKRLAHTRTLHGDRTTDDYYWLRNLDSDPDVKAYIAAENDYTSSMLSGTVDLQKALIAEMKEIAQDRREGLPSRKRSASIGPTTLTNRAANRGSFVGNCGTFVEKRSGTGHAGGGGVVLNFWEHGKWIYWSQLDPGMDYPIYLRRPRDHGLPFRSPRRFDGSNAGDDDEDGHPNDLETVASFLSLRPDNPGNASISVLLDVNALAKNHSYFSLGTFEVSPFDDSLLAYSFDTVGDEKFTLVVHNVSKGDASGWSPPFSHPLVSVPNTYYSVRWARFNKSADAGARPKDFIYYNVVDELGLPRSIYRVCVVGCEMESSPQPDARKKDGLSCRCPKNGDGRPAENCCPTSEVHDGAMPSIHDAVADVTSDVGQLVYTEPDQSLVVAVETTRNSRFLLVKISGQITSETRYVDTDTSDPDDALSVLFQRKIGSWYDVEQRGDSFVVRSNFVLGDDTEPRDSLKRRCRRNFAVWTVRTDQVERDDAKIVTLIPCSRTRFVERVEVFRVHVLAWVWESGLKKAILLSFENPSGSSSPGEVPLHRWRNVTFNAPGQLVYAVFPGMASDSEERLYRDFDATDFTFTNSSFVHPPATYSYDMRTGATRAVLKSRNVPAGYEPTNYTMRRLWAPSGPDASDSSSNVQDRVRVPISLVYRGGEVASDSRLVGTPLRGPLPLVLTAYGAYGSFIEPRFEGELLPLLSRGVVYALVHPRGDGDLGAHWYEEGKMENKEATFKDVKSAIEFLVEMGIAERGRVAVKGRSAGGLVAGAASSWGWDGDEGEDSGREGLVKAVVAQVPFVDVITDMIDASVPWTPFEWFEWGNPVSDPKVYAAMKRYSPYDLISRNQSFPAMLVTGGLYDTRVRYYEPTKWVAKIRSRKTNEVGSEGCGEEGSEARVGCTPLLLRINPWGHFASGGEVFQDTAMWYAFVLRELGVA